MATTLEFVAISALVFDKAANIRDPQNGYDVLGMVDDFRISGGQTSPLVVSRKDGSNIVLQGYRRCHGAQYLKENAPQEFEKLFPKGMLCTIHTGLSLVEEEMYKADHGASRPPTQPWELFLQMERMFGILLGEADIAMKMASLFIATGSKGKNVDKFLAATSDKERRAAASPAFRNRTQIGKAICAFPSYVRDYYERCLRPCYDTPNPRLIEAVIKELYSAYTEDLKAAGNGGQQVSKEKPGPTFTARWESFLATPDAERKEKESRLTTKALEEAAGRFSSMAVGAAFKAAAGSAEAAESLMAFDRRSYALDKAYTANADIVGVLTLWAEDDEFRTSVLAVCKERRAAINAEVEKLKKEADVAAAKADESKTAADRAVADSIVADAKAKAKSKAGK